MLVLFLWGGMRYGWKFLAHLRSVRRVCSALDMVRREASHDAGAVHPAHDLRGRPPGHSDFAPVFRFVFIAAVAFLGVALACVLAVEERPLYGPVRLADRSAEHLD